MIDFLLTGSKGGRVGTGSSEAEKTAVAVTFSIKSGDFYTKSGSLVKSAVAVARFLVL